MLFKFLFLFVAYIYVNFLSVSNSVSLCRDGDLPVDREPFSGLETMVLIGALIVGFILLEYFCPTLPKQSDEDEDSSQSDSGSE